MDVRVQNMDTSAHFQPGRLYSTLYRTSWIFPPPGAFDLHLRRSRFTKQRGGAMHSSQTAFSDAARWL